MASPYTGTTELANPVNVQFQRALLMVAEPHCPYFAGTTPAIIQGGQGTALTAKWRRFGQLALATTPLAELDGNATFPVRDATQISASDITATLAKYGAFILLNEEIDLVNIPSQNEMGFAKTFGIQAGRTLNALQRNEMEDNSTARFAGGVATVGAVVTAITAADIAYVINWLERNDARYFMPSSGGSQNIGTTPAEPAFIGVCHPDVVYDLEQITTGAYKWVPASEYMSAVSLMRYEQGKTGRIRWVTSTDSSIDADAGGSPANAGLRHTTTAGSPDSADIYNCVVYGEDAVGSVGLDTAHIRETYDAGDQLPGVMVISKPRGSSGVGDPLDEVATLGWKSWHAAKVLSRVNSESPAETLEIRNIRVGASAIA